MPLTGNLQRTKLTGFKLFDHTYLVYKTSSNCVVVSDSICPHRQAPLNLVGKLEGELLHCPEHDYYFDTNGKGFQDVFQLKPTPNCNLKTYSTRIISGLIFTNFYKTKSELSNGDSFPINESDLQGSIESMTFRFNWRYAPIHLAGCLNKVLKIKLLESNITIKRLKYSEPIPCHELQFSIQNSTIKQIKLISFGIGIFKLIIKNKTSNKTISTVFFLTPEETSYTWHFVKLTVAFKFKKILNQMGLVELPLSSEIIDSIWKEVCKPIKQNSVNSESLPTEINDWILSLS